MIKKIKTLNFFPKNLSSNKEQKQTNNTLDNLNDVKKNLTQNNLKNIDYRKGKTLKTIEKNNEDINSDLQYLINSNEKEKIDFINTYLKLKGLKNSTNDKIDRLNKTNNNKTEKNLNITIEKYKEKKNKQKIPKINGIKKNNNKTVISKRNCIIEVTIDLMDLKTQDSDKKYNNLKMQNSKLKSLDNKMDRNKFKMSKTKTSQRSPNNKILDLFKNQNYKNKIESKKKQLLEGKLYKHKFGRKIKNFFPGNINITTGNIQIKKKKKKSNFPIIEELDEDKIDIINVKVEKGNSTNPKDNEKMESYINNDDDIYQEDFEEKNKLTKRTIKNNNSIISNESSSNEDKKISSFFSTSTFNNDLVNYKSKTSLVNKNNSNNINNITNTNFSIITNSALNNDNNNEEEKINFLIENNSDMEMNDILQNDFSESILLENKDQIQPKINIYNEIKNNNFDASSQNERVEESIIEQFGIDNIQKQNESKEIELSQIKIKNNNKENNSSRSNLNLSLSNLSKLTNFVDSKFYDISHINKKDINININNYKKIKKPKEETNIKRIEQKNKKTFLNKTHNNKFFETKDSKEKEPKDSVRKKFPKDNFTKKVRNLKTINNSKKNIFEDEDINPTKKLVHTNKRDVIYINTENYRRSNSPFQVIFNNEMKEKITRNKSNEVMLKRYLVNGDKELNNKKINYTTISPAQRNNFGNINQNFSIKNNINNNIIINYKIK